MFLVLRNMYITNTNNNIIWLYINYKPTLLLVNWCKKIVRLKLQWSSFFNLSYWVALTASNNWNIWWSMSDGSAEPTCFLYGPVVGGYRVWLSPLWDYRSCGRSWLQMCRQLHSVMYTVYKKNWPLLIANKLEHISYEHIDKTMFDIINNNSQLKLFQELNNIYISFTRATRNCT